MPKQRRNIALSLSFLDIMACGFGAVTLLFLIFRHNVADMQKPDAKAAAELTMLQQDIQVAEQQRAAVLNSLEKLLRELSEAQGAVAAGDYRTRRGRAQHTVRCTGQH